MSGQSEPELESEFEVVNHEDVDPVGCHQGNKMEASSGSDSSFDFVDEDGYEFPVQPIPEGPKVRPAAMTKSKVPISDCQNEAKKIGLDVGPSAISNQVKEAKTAKMSTESKSTTSNVNLLASVGSKASDSKTSKLKKTESNFREFRGRMTVLDSAPTVANSCSTTGKMEAPSEFHSKSSGVNWERVPKPRDDRTGAHSHVAPITNPDDSKIYSEFMTRQFKLIQIQDIVENPNLLNDIEMQNPQLRKYSKTSKTRKYFSKILDYFRSVIQESENLFNYNICFLNEDELSPQLSKIFNPSRIPPSLSQYEHLIGNLVKSFQKEYLERNRQIVRIENDLISQLLSQAVGYFTGELKILQRSLLPSDRYNILQEEIKSDVVKNFIKACGFKNSSWKQPTLSKLRSCLSHISKSLETDRELEKLINDSVGICLKTLQDLQTRLTLQDKLELAEAHEKKARAAAFRNFVGSARKLTGEDNTQAYMDWKEKLDHQLDEAFQKKRADFLQAQRSLQIKQVLTKNYTSSHLSLPQKDLAIHFGLERTRVGIVAGNQFQPILEAENCLYFHPDHILLSTKETPRTSSTSKFPFKRFLLTDPLRILYNVDAGEDLVSCRLEAVLAMFFTKIKITAELKLQNEFRSCTIAVPQCLNTIQRTCVQDAATMAGFIPVTIVSDTTAAAVACMIEQPQIDRTITVATTLEDLLDVASFDVENGIVRCHGISGMYYLQDCSLWDKLCHSSAAKTVASTFLTTSNSSEKLVRRIFSQDELNNPSTYPATCFIIGSGPISELYAAETTSNYQKILPLDAESILRGTSYISALLQPGTNCVKEHWIRYLNGRNLDLALQDFADNITSCDNKRVEKNTCNLPRGSNMSVQQLMAELKQFRGCCEIRNNASKLKALDLIVQTGRLIASGHLESEPEIRRHIHDRARQLDGDLKNDFVSVKKVEEICEELADLLNNFRMT